MLLADLVEVWEALRATRSRTAKTAAIADLLRRAEPDEVRLVASYLAGDTPQGRVGIGYATVRAVDVPPAAEASVTLADVDAALDRIASLSGAGSQARRAEALDDLFARATEVEQAFMRGLLLSELRQGALEGVLIDAIAVAADAPSDAVRRAAMVSGEPATVAVAALAGGADALAGFGLELFRPLQPMLASTAADVPDGMERLGTAAVEPKLDGARVQVHVEGERVEVYSRSLRDITAEVPAVVAVARSLGVTSAILDGEAMAVRDDGAPEPFQVTMQRFGIDGDAGGPRPFFFDLLHLDGEDLLDLPAADRWERLDAAVPAGARVPRRVVDSVDDAAAMFDEVVAQGQEGVLLKAPSSTYSAGRRGAEWLKVKPVHTLDLVVLAAEWGSGRRRGWLSNLHLGARAVDPGPGDPPFVMLGKTFKGLTDELLSWQTARLLELEVRREGHVVHVRPELVVEIAVDGLQDSSRYPGGIALRFARVKRYREDKTVAEADTLDDVLAIRPTRRRAPSVAAWADDGGDGARREATP